MQNDFRRLIERIRQGDQSAFCILVKEYQEMAFNVAFRIMCDEDEAKDVVQESFIKIWQKIGNYDPQQKFSTWMYKIVLNSAIDRMRQIKRKNTVSLEIAGKSLMKLDDGDENEMDNKELAALIHRLASHLPERQRLIFIFRDLQGLSSGEVEQILDIPESVVKSNLYHARMSIRKKLERIME